MDRLVIRYLAERQARGEINARTAESTRRVLRRFVAICGDTPPGAIQRRHVEKFLARPGRSPGTRYTEFAKLRVFLRWLVAEGVLAKDPTILVATPKVPKSAVRRLTTVDSMKVAAYAPDRRGRVVVLLMLQELLRCGEVVAVQFGDLDLIAGTLAVRGKGGGGEVTRHIALSEETAEAIDAYLVEHPARSGPLVRSYLHPERGLSAHYVTQMVAEWMTLAGVKRVAWDGKTAHALRHTGASDMADRGADVLEIQRALGHDSLSSTMIYIKGVTPNLRTAMAGRSYVGPVPQQPTRSAG